MFYWVISLNVKPDRNIYLDNITDKYLQFVVKLVWEINNSKTRFPHVNHPEWLRGSGSLTVRSGPHSHVCIALTISRRYFWSLLRSVFVILISSVSVSVSDFPTEWHWSRRLSDWLLKKMYEGQLVEVK